MASPLPAKFKITTTYHKPGTWWSCGYHTGVDFACPIGTPITAAKNGTVLEASSNCSWGGAYGNAIIIDHGNGVHAIYAHTSQMLVKKGQKVTEGQLIAKSGNSGNSSGPHLHFETRVAPFRYANKDVDPKVLLQGAVKTSIKAAVTSGKAKNTTAPEPSKVYPGNPVDSQDNGDPVKALQIALGLKPTGKYDDELKKAIIAVQKKNKALGTADGVVGPKTWAYIVK
jgi:murein DD-endopeptidase MepM/ murein hydrolase activator NlpD